MSHLHWHLQVPRTKARKRHSRRLAAVYAELLTFDDPESHLPAIDRLEGFYPGGSCLYAVSWLQWAAGAVLPAWLFVGENSTMIQSALTGRPHGHDSPSLGLIR